MSIFLPYRVISLVNLFLQCIVISLVQPILTIHCVLVMGQVKTMDFVDKPEHPLF